MFVVGFTTKQANAVVLLYAKQPVGDAAQRRRGERTLTAGKLGFVGVTNRGKAHGRVLKQTANDLQRHLSVQAVHGLGGRVF